MSDERALTTYSPGSLALPHELARRGLDVLLGRVIRFPGDESFGMFVFYSGPNSRVTVGEADARGTVIVPERCFVEFINAGTRYHRRLTEAELGIIARVTNLIDLSIVFDGLDEAGLVPLASMTNLVRLSLGCTKLTDLGLRYLAELGKLTELDLSGTEVTDAGLAHLTRLTSLRTLDLRATGVTPEGLGCLAHLVNLSKVSLGWTAATDAELVHLAKLPHLRGLYLANTGLTDGGLTHLAHLTNLRELSLHASRVTPAGKEWLRLRLPSCARECAGSDIFSAERSPFRERPCFPRGWVRSKICHMVRRRLEFGGKRLFEGVNGNQRTSLSNRLYHRHEVGVSG